MKNNPTQSETEKYFAAKNARREKVRRFFKECCSVICYVLAAGAIVASVLVVIAGLGGGFSWFLKETTLPRELRTRIDEVEARANDRIQNLSFEVGSLQARYALMEGFYKLTQSDLAALQGRVRELEAKEEASSIFFHSPTNFLSNLGGTATNMINWNFRAATNPAVIYKKITMAEPRPGDLMYNGMELPLRFSMSTNAVMIYENPDFTPRTNKLLRILK